MKRMRIHMTVDVELPDDVPTDEITLEIVEQVLKHEAVTTQVDGVGRVADIMVMRLEHR